MNVEREFNASTVGEALEKAASTLGISPEEISYRVLDEGSSGFLGIGGRDARVLISTTEDEPIATEAHTNDTLITDSGKLPQNDTETVEPEHLTASEEVDQATEGQEAVEAELLAEIREHVEKLLSSTGLGGNAFARDDGEVISVDIESDETGLLIGQKGETIDALQYLVNVSMYRDRPFEKKIVLDAGGYRERRVKAVQGMALRAAKRASRDGKAVELPPMSSSERRAVHTYLKDDSRVTTSSNGHDEDRRVTILPA